MKNLILLSLLTFSLSAQVTKKMKNSHNLFSNQDVNANQKTSVAPANPLYSFTTFTAAYNPITGTSLSGGLKWDDDVYPVPIGFNFKVYNSQNDTITFAEASYATFDNPMSSNMMSVISPMFEDLCDREFNPNTDTLGGPGGISDISYTVTGTSGSRICKIQVSNAGYYGEIATYDTSTSYVNFQIWLYENSLDIEFRFGSTDIQNPFENFLNPAGFLCGLAENLNLSNGIPQSSNVLSGTYNNPSMLALTPSLNEVITGAIDSGRVYKFTRIHPNPVGLSEAQALKKLILFPNPANKILYCDGLENITDNVAINFYGLDGRLVSSGKLTAETDLSKISAGVYMVRVQDNKGGNIHSSKIVITE